MATPNDTQLQKGAIAPAQAEQTGSQKAVTLIENLVAQPTLPTGTTVTPQLQQLGTGELMATQGVQAPVAAAAPTATATTAPTAQAAAQMTAAQVAGVIPTATAAQGTLTAPAQAATGAITADATVKGQLQSLQNEVSTAIQSGNPLPVWARGAAKATEAAMNRRVMSASSMAAEALAEGIMSAAVPIAAQDADTYKQMIFQNLANNQQANIVNAQSYLQMDMANLSNNQQASLQNLNTRQAFLMSDQAAANAAYQFNVTSQNQVNQFYDNMSSQ